MMSYAESRQMARPVLPMRPVRPARWMYWSDDSGVDR